MVLIRAGLALFGSSLLIAALVLPLLERRALRAGPVAHPGGRHDHDAPTPLTGGIAIITAVALPAVSGLLVALIGGSNGWLPAEIAEHLPGIRSRAPQLLAILAGAAIMMILGYVDDRRGLGPWTKLGVQSVAAAALVAAGLRVTLYLDWEPAQVVLTIGFVVFVTNAVNFIDNMNGLMAGVVLIGSLHLIGLAIATGQLFMAAILVSLGGGLAAFLPRNFPKASVFVGDAGSLSIGFLLAALSVAFTFDSSNADGARDVDVRPFLIPIAALLVPIADGLTVICARLRRGVHPFTAGHDHLSHRLVRRGLSPTSAVVLLWAVQMVAGLPVVLLGGVPPAVIAWVWGTAGVVALVLSWRSIRRKVA